MTAVHPHALQPGATIGIVAPAGLNNEEKLQAGMTYLQHRGYRTVVGTHVHDTYGYLAGIDTAREADINEMFGRDDVDALLGTPWQLDCRGRILFLEDVDEEWHDVDRMLSHLALAGIFRDAIGIVMGEMVNVQNPDESKPSLHLTELYHDYLSGLDKPVLIDFPSGHGQDMTTLPLGCAVRLDASAASIKLLEVATI